MSLSTTETAEASQPAPVRRRRKTSLVARGEPMVWLTGGCVAVALIMILMLLGRIAASGTGTFWPAPLLEVTTPQGVFLGEPTRSESFHPDAAAVDEVATRTLYRTGNYDLTATRYTWLRDDAVTSVTEPEWAIAIERTGWGNAYGFIEAIEIDGVRTEGAAAAWAKFEEEHTRIRAIVKQVKHIQKEEIGRLGKQTEALRIEVREVELKHGIDSPEYRDIVERTQARRAELEEAAIPLTAKIKQLQDELNRSRLVVRSIDGRIIPADRAVPGQPMLIAQIVAAHPSNQLGFGDKIGVYLSRWWEYLSDEPREANMEGGVFPAIFGTVLMTFIMIILVVPIGVIAAIYLREYAKQGMLVSIVRIAVNNLAGVPSIVYGVFGLGFFCYLVGGTIDDWFFPVHAAEGVPMIGKSALLWASLTLALLTLPVVIVATEEALAAVPRSMREGSYGCGATKWQTIRRIVLPRALPGIMTGMILAVARGAGEVAPLMLVGAVKLAPELPLSTERPFFGVNQSFMHLGFHLYDLGFQSPDSEGAKPMVYTTTLLLIAIVVLLNLAAMWLRSRLRRNHSGGMF